MKSKITTSISVALIALTFIACKPMSTISVKDAETAFDYAYPLVIMEISQDLMLVNPMRPSQKPNQLILFKQLAQPQNRAVVLGNRNTLYTVGWIDLSKGPVIFTFPDMGERYFVMPLIDAWTNTFKSIGSRTTGQKAQKYFLVNKEYTGEIPEGFEKVVCPTNMVWITGRIQADNDSDAKLAAELQSQYELKSYAEYEGQDDPFANWEATYNLKQVKGNPVPYTLNIGAKEYYDLFFKMWINNTSPQADKPFINVLAKAGITREKTMSFDLLPQHIKDSLTIGLENKQKKYLADFYKGKSQTTPWIFNIKEMGTWGTDYSKRAYWGIWGLGANLVQDAVYGVTQLDKGLNSLNGQNVYKVHFKKDETPDVGAFWSITTYDIEGYLEQNDQNRYASGSNMPLKYNEDGSLDLYLSSALPQDVSQYNWIPAPSGTFKILFRMYWPKESILDGSYTLPNIEKM